MHLPPATEATHDFKPDMMNIAVDKAGTAWLEQRAVTLAELGRVVSNRFLLNTNLPVFISGDQDTKHGAMLDVLQTVRNAGVQKVAFMVDDQTAGGTP